MLALFGSLDADGNDIVDFAELAAGLSLLCGGSSDDKITAVFKLFDLDGDGVITLTEMTTYLTSVCVGLLGTPAARRCACSRLLDVTHATPARHRFRVIFDRTPELEASLNVTADRLAEVRCAPSACCAPRALRVTWLTHKRCTWSGGTGR